MQKLVMSKYLIFGLLIAVVVLSGCMDAEDVIDTDVDLEQSEGGDVVCDAEKACPEEQECISLPEEGHKCVSKEFANDPCVTYECPEGTTCSHALSYPSQVICGSSDSSPNDTETVEQAIDTNASA